MSSIDQSLAPPRIVPSTANAQRSGRVAAEKTVASHVPTPILVAVAIVSAILVPSRMLLSRGEPDDSGVFAYIGWAMKHGLMPYRDVWDHKGPLLYYLQFAGMSLRSTSTFGIGLLEVIAFAIAFFLIYRVIASFASLFVGLVIAAFSIAFVTHFYAGGNMTESWALLPLAGAHYAGWRWSGRLSLNWCAAVIGACFTCIFFLRPNMGAYPAVAMLVLLYASKKRETLGTAVKQFALACAAVGGLSGVMVAPLYHWEVFHDFVAAYFGYNAAYSRALSWDGRYLHTSQLLMLLFATAIAILGAAGWTLAIKENRGKKEVIGGLPSPYLQSLLWSLPVEIAAAALSGRDYPHYLLPLFPTLVVLAAWFLSELQDQMRAISARPALVTTLLLGLCPFALLAYAGDFSHSTEAPRPEFLAVAQFIQRATTPKDKITVVETESGYITFLAQRLPASRFVYQLPLIDANNPVAGEQRKQFMCDLAKNRPAVIVSSHSLFGVLCATPLDCPAQDPQTDVAEYGYQYQILPKLFSKVVASDYRQVPDPRFGAIRVLVRKDIAIPSQW
jgi:hypothetical protein